MKTASTWAGRVVGETAPGGQAYTGPRWMGDTACQARQRVCQGEQDGTRGAYVRRWSGRDGALMQQRGGRDSAMGTRVDGVARDGRTCDSKVGEAREEGARRRQHDAGLVLGETGELHG
jgi:hypothetical protein